MVLTSLLSSFWPESALIRQLRAQKEKSAGLELALRYAAMHQNRSRSARLPRVVVYPDVLPAAKVAKNIVGPGVLLISQGLLSHFRDEELVMIMRCGLKLLSQRGAGIKSVCSAGFVTIEKVGNQPWTPFRALLIWCLLPFKSFLQRQDQKLNVFRATLDQEIQTDPTWRDALRKVSCSERIFS
jgi:hypothetical protein